MGWFDRLFRGRGFASGVADAASPTDIVAGRVRVRGVPYNLPRDLEEMNRLDFQHYMFRYALRGNYAAPVDNPASILDVGTGTGRWAREMAQLFPQARVVGLDVNPPPVDTAASAGSAGDLRPPNYSFTAGNILEGLPFPDGSFDFVHMRLLVSAIPHDRWPYVVSELVRVTRPGGWVESVEAVLPTNGGPVAERVMDWIRAISLRRGIEISDAMSVAELLRTVGVADVTTQPVEIPCGDYGGRVGKMMATDYFSGVKAVGGVITAQGLATQEQFDQTLALAMRDIASPRYRCVFPVYIAYGRRIV